MLHERQAGARSIPARVIERRRRPAPIGRVLVEPDRWLHEPPAGQSNLLAVGGKAKIERTVAQGPAHVERVVLLLVAVVGAVAVGLEPIHRAVDAETRAAIASVHLAFERVVGPDAAKKLEALPGGQRRAGHDVDDARSRAIAVKYAARSAHDLDSLDRSQRDGGPLHAREVEVVQPTPV